MPRGSKPGERRGGRVKGTKNRATLDREAILAKYGITPLEVLVEQMVACRKRASDPKGEASVRVAAAAAAIEAAKHAAPYCHPRLASHELGTKGDGSVGIFIFATDAGL